MKYLLTALILILLAPRVYTLEEAKAVAGKERRGILLTFSGSDWCVPCIRMEKEIFGGEACRFLCRACRGGSILSLEVAAIKLLH